MSTVPDGIPNELWERRELIMRKNQSRRDTRVPVPCNCGSERWLTISDARKTITKDTPCKACHTRRIGRIGFDAVMRKYGFQGWLEIMQKSGRDNPPSSEIIMMELLDESLPPHVEYIHQWIHCGHICDFLIGTDDNPLFILEVIGYWHRHNQRTLLRDEHLVMTSNIPVLFVNAEPLYTHDGKLEIIQTINIKLLELLS